MYPIRLTPAYQHYIWGGNRIGSYFNRDLPINRYAESWEVSDRSEGMTYVANGFWKGTSLKDLISREKQNLLGPLFSKNSFPLLTKIIDSKEHLSVQIHPDESASIRLQAEPKSECWIALENSTVFAGLKPSVTQRDFLKAIENNTAQELLLQFNLRKGQAIFIPAGLVHAICADAFILEVQQNSNTTYRLFDWGRLGRELHLEKGLSCIAWDQKKEVHVLDGIIQFNTPQKVESLMQTPYFDISRIEVYDHYEFINQNSLCRIIFLLEGQPLIDNEPAKPGTSYIIPASCKQFSIKGACQFIFITPNPGS